MGLNDILAIVLPIVHFVATWFDFLLFLSRSRELPPHVSSVAAVSAQCHVL
jgi:hypothetical protein